MSEGVGGHMNGILDNLSTESLKLLVEAAFVGLLTLGAALLARNMVRRGDVWVKGATGRTRMSPFILLLALFAALVAAASLSLGFIFPQIWLKTDELLSWIGLVAIFTFFFLILLPFTRHSWEWDASRLQWHGAWRSRSMPWSDIARLGKSWDGQFFAADKNGRKIFWSEHVLQHEALSRAVTSARPDLKLPA